MHFQIQRINSAMFMKKNEKYKQDFMILWHEHLFFLFIQSKNCLRLIFTRISHFVKSFHINNISYIIST